MYFVCQPIFIIVLYKLRFNLCVCKFNYIPCHLYRLTSLLRNNKIDCVKIVNRITKPFETVLARVNYTTTVLQTLVISWNDQSGLWSAYKADTTARFDRESIK